MHLLQRHTIPASITPAPFVNIAHIGHIAHDILLRCKTAPHGVIGCNRYLIVIASTRRLRLVSRRVHFHDCGLLFDTIYTNIRTTLQSGVYDFPAMVRSRTYCTFGPVRFHSCSKLDRGRRNYCRDFLRPEFLQKFLKPNDFGVVRFEEQ